MPLPAMIPEIRPISELRTNLADIEACAKEQGTVVLTRNGKPSLVVMDSDAYNAEQERIRHEAKLREAEIEARYRPKGYSLVEAKAHTEELFAKMADMGLSGSHA